MFRESIAPIATATLLTISACSGGSEGNAPETTPPITPDFTVPETLPHIALDTVPETTSPENFTETTPFIPETTHPDDYSPILESEIGNTAICDALYGPDFVMADLVDEDPFDIETDYSSLTSITYRDRSKDAEIVTYSIKGLGEQEYSVLTNDGQETLVDLSLGDADFVEFGDSEENSLLVAKQSDESVWFTTMCSVEMIEPKDADPEIPSGIPSQASDLAA